MQTTIPLMLEDGFQEVRICLGVAVKLFNVELKVAEGITG